MKSELSYRWARLAGVLICAGLVVGCATPPEDPIERAEYAELNDPLEPTNREIFEFNQAVDDAVLEPVARGYRATVPAEARDSLRNFFNHIESPVIFINDVLQGEGGRAAETAVRFFVNSTAGFFGFFDVAADYGLDRHGEDFGQTLAVWGVDEGPYLMLPIFGPSNVRDTVGMVADNFMNPFTYLAANNNLTAASMGTSALDGVDTRSRHIEELEDIERTALDLYATIRSLYRQNRESEILNGAVVDIPVPTMN